MKNSVSNLYYWNKIRRKSDVKDFYESNQNINFARKTRFKKKKYKIIFVVVVYVILVNYYY